jgi:formate transporter
MTKRVTPAAPRPAGPSLGARDPAPVVVTGFDPLLPPEMARRAEDVGVSKATMDVASLFALAVLAGAFIALGAEFFTVVTTASGLGYGVNRLVGGAAFSLGLYLVVVAGAELFTGNNLIVMAWASRKIATVALLRNWTLVYVGNFVGALATAGLVFASGQWRFVGGEVGANALRIAAHKTGLSFPEAVALGVLCNALVCLAVWLCYSARSNIDRAISIVFPITAFVASGFEHSIANMYFVPMGLFLKGDDAIVAAADLPPSDLAALTWADFFLRNLAPVTIGNIIGGAALVGAVYWFIYLRPRAGRG